MRIAFIYKITNPKNKIYIGSTFDYKKRFNEYKTLNCKRQGKLYNSLKKYGYDNHKFELICECNIQDRNTKENYYGILYNCLSRDGLNSQLPKANTNYFVVSDETRLRLSNLAKLKVGNKNPMFGKKRIDFGLMAKKRGLTLIGEKNPMFGKKRPKELIDKLKKLRKEKELNGISPRNKIVVDINTGIFYNSAMEVIKLYKLKKSTFVSQLNNNRKNTTQFIYA
jgi:group I intron endonuclease